MTKAVKNFQPLGQLHKLNEIALRDLNRQYSTGYRFGEKDIICDQICSLMDQTGATATKIAGTGVVAYSTVRNIVKGKTKRPQNGTVEACLRAMGYTRETVKFKLQSVK